MEYPVFKDVLVLELASVLAGPSVGQFFAELGARVIKIENAATHGDVTRTWKLATEQRATDVSAYFSAANWGKFSVALDLTNNLASQAVQELVAEADILIASYKPGDAEKLGMDYGTLAKLNPGLVYGHITGYGSNDNRAGYDAVVQAESGFMYMNGESTGPPVKLPVALMDILAAHQLKEGLLTALLQRERTGKGAYVQVSLFDAAISALANQATNYLVAGHNPQRMGSEHPNIMPYGRVYVCKDGLPLVLAVGDDRQFQRLCEALGQPELAKNQAYHTNAARLQHREQLNQILDGLIGQYPRQALLDNLHRLHVPAGAVNSVAETLENRRAQRMVMKQDGAAGIRQVAFTSDQIVLPTVDSPPSYGQHTDQVLPDAAKV